VPIRKISRIAVTALEDIKARDITVFDVRKLTSLYDTLIIATAESNRQVKALAHHVRDKLKEAGAIFSASKARTGEWVPADAGEIISISCSRWYACITTWKSWSTGKPSRARTKASDRGAA
jgi:ribosome silencing factor RsfS/YbeB/iojap